MNKMDKNLCLLGEDNREIWSNVRYNGKYLMEMTFRLNLLVVLFPTVSGTW